MMKPIPFRYDINGLRALAVLAVILFHFRVPGFHGGFVGVDVFFVISGYLMTVILLRRMSTVPSSRWMTLSFYLDRARRIIPALFFLCLVLLVYGWFFLLPVDYESLGKHSVSSLGFFSNIVYWRESGYFDTSVYDKWLIHTWSLSVEWQFYIIYPLFLLLCQKLLPLHRLRYAILALMLFSFALNLYISAYWPDAAFYWMPTRAWEMLMGGLVFLFPVRLGSVQQSILFGLGILLIVFSVVICSQSQHWPGWWALLPVAGASSLILANRNTSRLLNNGLMQWIGTVSYSVYLWHWPIVVVLNANEVLDQPLWQGAGILVSLLLGSLSYLVVEKPWRSATMRCYATQSAITLTLSIFFTLAVISEVVYWQHGFDNGVRMSMNEKEAFIQYYKKLHQHLSSYYRLECDFNDAPNQIRKKIDPTCTDKIAKNTVFLWGDSTAQALSYGLRQWMPDKAVNQVASSTCRPELQVAPNAAENTNQYYCNISNQFALKKIREQKPRIVILSQLGHHDQTDWNAVANQLHAYGVEEVILVGPGPGWAPPERIAKQYWQEKTHHIAMLPALDHDAFKIDKQLKQRYVNAKNIHYISLIDALCQGQACLTFIPGSLELMSVDGTTHFSPQGSRYVANHILSGWIAKKMA